MASLLERIRRIETARAQAAEKAQARRPLDPIARSVRLSSMYARASTTGPATLAHHRACRVMALIDSATDRAGLPRLSSASIRGPRTSRPTTTGMHTPGPSASDVHARLERQAQRNEAELFNRLQFPNL